MDIIAINLCVPSLTKMAIFCGAIVLFIITVLVLVVRSLLEDLLGESTEKEDDDFSEITDLESSSVYPPDHW